MLSDRNRAHFTEIGVGERGSVKVRWVSVTAAVPGSKLPALPAVPAH
jgi:hypothetical protein